MKSNGILIFVFEIDVVQRRQSAGIHSGNKKGESFSNVKPYLGLSCFC